MKTERPFPSVWTLHVLLLTALCGSAQPVIRIAPGFEHSLFLMSDGSLWVMGSNDNGQLGDGTYNNTNLPEQLIASNITAIAAGYFHSLFISNNGALWGMGYSYPGELGGLAPVSPYLTNRPGLIVARNVTAIAAGASHSLFISNNASLWAMGDDTEGELGDGRFNSVTVPERIASSNITAIAAGFTFSLFTRNNGSLWGMGANYDGELGAGEIDNSAVPVQIAAGKIVALTAGDFHSLYLSNNGSLWGMGRNFNGQLGIGSVASTNKPVQIVASNVTAVAAGSLHSLFIKSDGSLWGMGDNSYGQLGENFDLGTDQPEEILPGGVIAVAAKRFQSMFLKSDGSLWVMGDNGSGQLGGGTNSEILLPRAILEPADYGQLVGRLMAGGTVVLSSVGVSESRYALERTFNLLPPDWVPLATNSAGAGGIVIFTNTPVPTTNNFWRVRSENGSN